MRSISVIIPHFNDLENLDYCLSLLQSQTIPKTEYEVVVADNRSDCGIERVRTVCGNRARVILAPNPGAGEARNAGVSAATGDMLAFTDSDCRPRANWLEEGIQALNYSHLVGGQVEVEVLNPDTITAVEAFEKVFAFRFDKYVRKEKFAGAGNMFVSTQTFKDVGPFRARLSEDKEWGQRAAAKGFEWHYAPKAIVGHPARRTWSELVKKWRRLQRESYFLSRERECGRVMFAIRAFAVLISPIPHSLNIITSKNISGWTVRFKAIMVLFAIRLWRFGNCVALVCRENRA